MFIKYEKSPVCTTLFAKKILSTNILGYISNELSISSYDDEDLTTEVPDSTTDTNVPVDTSEFDEKKIIGERQLHWVMNIINNIKTGKYLTINI